MVEPKAGIKRLARETRQRIYDYIFSDTGDQTIKVTLDQHDKLHFENGNTIFDLVLTDRMFAEEVLPYLFQYITFALTDSLRTCIPIVQAFFHTFKVDEKLHARKIAIPFFTIRGFLDLARITYPYALGSGQGHHGSIIHNAQINSYVLSKLASGRDYKLLNTTPVLLRDLEYTFQLLNQMPGLKSLKLGVDVVEFLACSVPYYTSGPPRDVAGIVEQVRQGTSGVYPENHYMLRALRTLNGMGRLRKVKLELDWGDFVLSKYRAAGVVFGPLWTSEVKQEMEERFEDMILW